MTMTSGSTTCSDLSPQQDKDYDFRMKTLLLLLLLSLSGLRAQATVDDIRNMLVNAPVQEKVYLHLDNQCYYKGDTIWYKAYVVRADSLTYTDMSHILYVELLSPDGMLVERHQVIVSGDGYSDGDFVLRDSIYSGYYELRAYTRWMLNFRVSEHSHNITDVRNFYNRQMAEDFFRQFDVVFSRVVPVYERPEEPGEYAAKYIVSRPKTRIEKELKEQLTVTFFPEGGHLVAGQMCTVAFEAIDEDGEQQDVTGRLYVPDLEDSLTISTNHQGRGVFTVRVPEDGRLKARFPWHGKNYSFDLPKTEKEGCVLRLNTVDDTQKVIVTLGGLTAGGEYGVAILCRGKLQYFKTIMDNTVLTVNRTELPTGVNDLLVFDGQGQLLADRLFFVNNHDYGQEAVSIDAAKTTFDPFEQIELHFKAPAEARHLSISVRDGATDELTYDTGNMLTDLLLSSELKGFVAYPDYYFEADDADHRRHLDLLMMVQGWRRYDYHEMTSDTPLRYKPEKTMTIEGSVYPTGDSPNFEPEETRYWPVGVFGYNPKKTYDISGATNMIEELYKRIGEAKTDDSEDGESAGSGNTLAELEGTAQSSLNLVDPARGQNYFQAHGGLKKEVTVVGELVFEDDIATVEMETENGGHFVFQVPPYYGQAFFFLRAYDTDISDKKLHRIEAKGVLDETAIPEYYVKRDLFYPVFAKKYSYYQCHQPQEQGEMGFDDSLMPEIERISTMDTKLRNVNVKGKRRRGRHRIDYSKPACVYDTQELYNLVTDRGLSYGIYDPRNFPAQVSMALLGNYNSEQAMTVQARLNDGEHTPYVYYRNFDPGVLIAGPFRSDYTVSRDIMLNRQDIIRLYTDFELRNEEKRIDQQINAADVTLDFILMPDDSKRYTYRDRRMILNGMTEPDDFYHPDYSRRPLPANQKDYRRTLYWNPNARLDEEGRYTAIFYNNSKQTRIRVSVAGLTTDGKPVTYDSKQ